VPATPHDVAGDADVAALVEGYRTRVAPLATQVLGSTESGLARASGSLGRLAVKAQRAYAGTDAAVVSPGAVRADIDAGPITYAEVAEAFSYGHQVVRARMSGRELRALAEGRRFYSGPDRLDPDAIYSVAASEMLLPGGRPVGTEVEALAEYLKH
jgi:5'-nucleotidase